MSRNLGWHRCRHLPHLVAAAVSSDLGLVGPGAALNEVTEELGAAEPLCLAKNTSTRPIINSKLQSCTTVCQAP